AGPANVTVTPGTGFPNASVTTADSGPVNVAVTAADWPPPEETATPAAGPAELVSANDAGDATPSADAVTVYVPAAVFAVALTLASPAAPVVAAAPPGNAADAPLPGAAN